MAAVSSGQREGRKRALWKGTYIDGVVISVAFSFNCEEGLPSLYKVTRVGARWPGGWLRGLDWEEGTCQE